MDVVDPQRFRDAFSPSGGTAMLDHEQLQGLGRRRRLRSRVMTGSLTTLMVLAVVGALTSMSQPGPRMVEIEPVAGPPTNGSVEHAGIVHARADEIWFELRAATEMGEDHAPDCHVWVDYGTDELGRIGGIMLCGEPGADDIELSTLSVGVETGDETVDTVDADTTLVLGLVAATVTEVRATFSDGEQRMIETTDLRGLPGSPPLRVALLAIDGPVTVVDGANASPQ